MTTRRSPRTTSRFNNGCLINSAADNEEGNKFTAIILALCECTDLSCDSIMVLIREFFNHYYAAEEIWDLRWIWINRKALTGGITEKDVELMIAMAKEVNIQTPGLYFRKDSKFSFKPKTVPFATHWNQNMDVLCNGFGIKTREFTKKWLLRKNRAFRTLGSVTDYERDVVQQFGKTVERMLKSTLKKWSINVLAALDAEIAASGKPHDPIDIEGQVHIIMDHIKHFQDKWENIFGRLEPAGENYLDVNNIMTMAIPSTGYGAKVLIGMMMSDRISVLSKLRNQARKEGEEHLKQLDDMKVDPVTLDEDCRMCPICRQTMGVKDSEAIIVDDVGVKMPCCRQVIGAFCLRHWLRRIPGCVSNKSCPICRHKCSEYFIDMIFEGHEEEESVKKDPELERDAEGRIVVDLITPEGSPQRQIEQAEDDIVVFFLPHPDILMDYAVEDEIVTVVDPNAYVSDFNYFNQQAEVEMHDPDSHLRPGDYDFTHELGASIEPIYHGQQVHFDTPVSSIDFDD